MSFYRIPVGVRKRIDYHRARLVWQEDKNKKKYHLVRWDVVCQPKEQGGLGIINIDIMNQALLAKWLWKIENESGLWQTVIRNKYVKNECISGIRPKPGDSQFWSGIMGVKNVFYKYCKKMVGDGRNTRFWEDWWVDDKPLRIRYPRLYNICQIGRAHV